MFLHYKTVNSEIAIPIPEGGYLADLDDVLTAQEYADLIAGKRVVFYEHNTRIEAWIA